MRKAVYIGFLSLFFSIFSFAQSGLKIENISAPEYVLSGEEFSISAKVTKEPGISSVELFLHTNIELSLVSAKLKSPTDEKFMRYYRIQGEESSFDKVYKLESGDISSFDEDVFQITCELSVSGNEEVKAHLTTIPIFYDDFENERNISTINVYKRSTAAGKSLELKPESETSIPFIVDDGKFEKVAIEYWAKINSEQSEILRVTDELGLTLVEISLSEFKYLTTSHLLDAEYFDEYFIDYNSWNYLFLEMNKNTGEVSCFINNKLFYRGIISEVENRSSCKLILANDAAEESYFIDRLKIWAFGNSAQLALQNKTILSYSADSSKIVYQNNFDSDNSLKDIEKSGNFNLISSSAPIFSPAPILNVMLFGQSYQLSWDVTDIRNASKFVVEKSYDGKNYDFVGSILVVDKSVTKYNMSDVDYSDNQIIYYRVKQVNKDNSTIYSADAKVGRGKIKHFVLEQNYPNPFNPITTISVEVKRADQFEVLVYDIVGKTVAILHNGPLSEGTHQFNFDGSAFPSGLYLCEIKSGDEIEVMKMILAK